MAFKRLATLAPLKLPVGDHVYEIAPVDADLGLFLTEFSATIASAKAQEEETGAATVPAEQQERLAEMAQTLKGVDTLERMLGADNLAAMKADGLAWSTIQLVAQTVMTWTVSGLEEAEHFWNTGGRPKAKKPQDRKRPARKG